MSVTLYAREVGQGTPLVFLHAFPLSSAMWLDQREQLAHRFRVVTPDLRGFGGSPLGDDHPPSIDTMADDVARALDARGIERAVIGGHAMGGYVAMAFARRYPKRLLGLILADTRAAPDPESVRADRLRRVARIEDEGTVQVVIEEVLPELVGHTTLRHRALVYGRVRGLVQATPPPAAAWALRAMADRPDAFDTLRETRVPALVLVGDEDMLASEADARAMAAALPNGEAMVIQRSGHLTPVEQPALFNQAVTDFVAATAKTRD